MQLHPRILHWTHTDHSARITQAQFEQFGKSIGKVLVKELLVLGVEQRVFSVTKSGG